MNPSSPAPDSEDSEYQPQDRAAPALRKMHNTLPMHEAALRDEPPRGEVFDVELDQNGQIIAPNAAPKRAGLWFLAALAALFCTYNLGAYVGQKSKTPAPIAAFAKPKEALPPLRLQIAGRVKKPGVYSLPGGARIEDALKIAGGTLPGADLSALNLADWAVDGSKIEVPARRIAKVLPTPTPRVVIKEVFVTPPQNAPQDTPIEAPAASRAMSGAGLEAPARQNARQNAGSSKTAAKTKPKPRAGKTSEAALAALRRSPVDLNRAGAEQLANLPGVGPKMAERIIAYRQENGGFKNVADLDNVKGIGEKRMAVLQSLVKVK